MINTEKPLFTIGIASYNYEQYIVRLLNSIKNQTFKDYDILISDDCSIDNSVKEISSFISQNPEIRIRFIQHEKNMGLVANKNTIIHEADGNYLMLCDADDYMGDDCLAELAKMIYDKEPDRIITNVVHVDEKGNTIQVEKIPENQSRWNWFLHHGCVYKMEIINDNNLEILSEPDDVFFITEFNKCSNTFEAIRKDLYYWFVHTDSEGRKSHDADRFFNDVILKEKEYIIDSIHFLENDGRIEEEVEELKLAYLKLYSRDLLFQMQRWTLKEKLYYYDKLKIISEEKLGDYWTNIFLSIKSGKMRPFAMRVVLTVRLFEKMRMMKLVLVLYHIVSRVKYFDQ